MKILSAIILALALILPACTKELDYTGLIIKDVKKGSGKVVGEKDEIYVYYTGYFKDGRIFDSNKRKSKPSKYSMRSPTLIPGWKKGILGMKAGGLRTLTIPPHLAFGERGKGSNIPPNSTVLFDIELISIK